MFLKPGDQVSVSDLNKGVNYSVGEMTRIALADYVAGSPGFFHWFDEWLCAPKLGLTNTTFKTVHGLDAPGQFSTARHGAVGESADPDVPDEYAIHKEKVYLPAKFASRTATVCCGAATLTWTE